jgi:hypothetical protein
MIELTNLFLLYSLKFIDLLCVICMGVKFVTTI